MKNIKFNYLYRDGANYKNANSIVFNNQSNIELSKLDNLIQSILIGGSWFHTKEWNLPDLHFDTWDNELDHVPHEFKNVEYTDEPPNTSLILDEFIVFVKKANRLKTVSF